MLVVAGALAGSDGRWLMHRRPDQKHHGGLWEFPGGKVERAEIPVKALLRELHEELGIGICAPVCFAEDDGQFSAQPIVILLYTVRCWTGIPRALEGGRIDWFDPGGIIELEKPPLDRQLAGQLFGFD